MVFDEYLEFYQHSICPSEKHCQAFLNQIGFKKSYFTTGFKKIHTKSEIYSKRKIRTKKTWYCLLVFLVCTVDFCSGKGRDILNERSPLLQTQGYLNAKIFQGSGSKNVRDLDVESLDVENFDDFYFRDFKYLKKWGNDTDVLLVLGRNNVYMIDPYASTPIVYFKERLHSVPTNSERAQCLRSIREEVYCHNYILNAHLLNNTKLKVCGTNSISPKCRYYTREQFNQTNPTENSYYSAEEPCNACPSTSKRNSLLLKVDNGSSTSTMYGAFYAYSYLGNNPLLVRANNFLKTQADCFTDPNFLKMLDYKEKVYLFFTETTTNMEAEKPSHQEIHSQVAQVCKNDNYDNKWRTFLKARLYCNVKQDKGFRFEYNILTAVSEVISVVLKPGQEPTDVIFATFTTPREWEEMGLLSSAVCMYSMSDSIISLFENKDFLSIEYKEGDNSVFWAKPIPAPDQNLGRLGRCVYRNESLQAYIDFASTNFRMYDAVTPLYDGAIYVTESNIRTSQILIDSNAGDMNELMIFLGTESGNVLRVKPRKNKKALLMEEIQLVDKADESDSGINSVKKLFIPRRKQSQKVHLLVGFTNRVLFVPLASCSQHYNETICQGDPECGFDGRSCVERTFENRERLGLVQSLTNVLVAETKRGKNTTAIEASPASMIANFMDNLGPELKNNLDRGVFSLDEKKQCLAELKRALNDTATVVIANYKSHRELPYHTTVKGLTHVLPLILHHRDSWHKIALEKMVYTEETDAICINNKKYCTKRAQFTTPLAPSLWLRLKELMKDEYSGVRCNDTPSSESINLCSEFKCNGTNSCKKTRCVYDSLTDVKSFFRLYSKSNEGCNEPFKKIVHVKGANSKINRRLFELRVNKRCCQFEMVYNPVDEEITITFGYKLSNRSRKSKAVNTSVQQFLNGILDRTFIAITKRSKGSCIEERKRRSSFSLESVNHARRNSVKAKKYENFYCTDWFRLRSIKWSDLVDRTRQRNTLSGQDDQLLSPNTLKFVSQAEVRTFFQENCVVKGADDILQRTIRTNGGSPNRQIKKSIAQIVVDYHMPFEIQKYEGRKKAKIKFYAKTI